MFQQNDPVADDGSSTSEHSSTDSYVSITAEQFEQNPDFKDEQYDRVARIFNGKWTVEQLRSLTRTEWTQQPEDVQRNWQIYVPEWTRPGWDPTRIVKINGTLSRAAHPNEAVAMRATIMPSDQEPRTDYAL